MVTSLFADISGFTTLSEQLDDPEALHGIIAPVIGRLAAIAERYGGFIAKYAGDALLVFFGAPVAHEDDAARALLVALDMHRDLPSILADLPAEAQGLELHIGVNTGRVISGRFGGEIRNDYSILGDAVILAQRLESVAGPGTTLVGADTFELTKEQFELESVGELALKGKTRLTSAYRLVGTRELPSISGTVLGKASTPLIGRDAELGKIEQILGPLIQEHRGGVISIVGEPGVGKSRLLLAVHERAAARGVRWYQARCLTYGATLPYWPAIDLLRQVMGFMVEDPPDVIQSRIEARLAGVPGALPYLARLLGLPAGDAVADLEPEAFRRGLHRAFCDWVVSLSAQAPIILTVEDLHWADSASLALGAELAALGATHPVAVIVTTRPEGEERGIALTGDLASLPRSHVRVDPFDASSTRLFLRSLLDGEPPSRLVDLVAERTRGNPLFVEEIVRALREMGSLVFDGTRWRMSTEWDAGSVPDTIERVLAARIDLLPASTAGLLQTASVLGRVVRLSLMTAMAAGTDDLDAELDRLTASGFLDPTVDSGEDAVMFHHALVQEVAYGRILRRHRRDLHRRVVEVAEQLYGAEDEVIDLLARHAYLGETGAQAIDYLTRAGDRSRRIFANDQAVLHFRHAAEVAESDPAQQGLAGRVAALRLAVAELEDLMGEFDEASRLYEEVRTSSGAVEAWKGLASIARRRGDAEGALRQIDEAFSNESLVGLDLTPLWVERVIALVSESRYFDAIEAAQTGLAATATPDTIASGHLLLQQARAETAIERTDEALTHAGQALRVFEANGDLRGQASALRGLGGIHNDAGRHEDATRVLRRALPLAERIGSVEEIMACLVNLGVAELRIGELDAALAHSRRALEEAGRVGHTIGEAIISVNLAEILLRRGDVEEASISGQRGIDLASEIGDPWTLADGQMIMAEIRLDQGFAGEATRQAEKAAALFVEMGNNANAASALKLAARAAERDGDTGRARSLSDRAHSLSAA